MSDSRYEFTVSSVLKPARWAFLAALVVGLPLGALQAQEQHPFAAAVMQALQTNPDVRSSRASLDSAKEKPVGTTAALRPTITFTSTATHTASFYGTTKSKSDPRAYKLDLSQPIYNKQLFVADEQAMPYVEAAKEDVQNTLQDTILSVAEVYVGLLEAQEVAALSVNNLKVTSSQLEATRARFEVGEITRTDVRQGEARVASAEAQVKSNQNAVSVSEAKYREVVGMPPPQQMPVPSVEDALMHRDLDQLIAQAEAHRPDLLAAQERLKVDQLGVNYARAGHYPTLTFSANGTFTDDAEISTKTQDSRAYTFVLTAEVPVYEGGGTQSTLRQAKHTLAASRADLDSQVLQIRREVEEALLNYRSALAVVTSYESALAASQDALNGVEQEFQVGTRTALDLLDQQNEVFRNQTELAKQRFNVILARFRLLSATGELTLANLGLTQEVASK
ncbi:type I secretion outer membrane protein, TolC family [Magnetococcus marinus MC-1]|uniref:Type I secretion outer membrane protein, TolC family n=1 Tax=Magnetococcus marinus (strain ATCC BAA-1437 / JCM 17883 / MC-1) TaxID=156889 RepID=A0L5K0_MAGMM|nr:TolC family outer membrane protein [Magnetococcus marinus]ABK43243.1 type I secretion outer membrane protein, TolC family [Magnetococcus marinus MC-1]